MKHFILCLLFACTAARADWIITQRMEGAGHTGDAIIKIKDGKIRADVTPEVSMISDTATGDIRVLMHQQKAFLFLNADTVRQLMERALPQPQTGGTAEPKWQPTGAHAIINGFETDIYTSQSGALKATCWVAKNYPNEARVLEALQAVKNSPMSTLARKMTPQPADLPGVPIKTELELTKEQKITITLLTIKEEPVSETDFTIPPGYKASPMPSFGKP